MSSSWRRYEVLLPTRFNDGREVPGDWLTEAVLEIVGRFGAASYESQRVEGHWRHAGVLYRDDLVKIVVDLPDSDVSCAWMRDFKERWKTRLAQIDLWMVSYPVDARGGRRGLSSFVDSALRLQLQHERLRALLEEMDAEHGPIAEDILEEVRREWPGKPRKHTQPRRG